MAKRCTRFSLIWVPAPSVTLSLLVPIVPGRLQLRTFEHAVPSSRNTPLDIHVTCSSPPKVFGKCHLIEVFPHHVFNVAAFAPSSKPPPWHSLSFVFIYLFTDHTCSMCRFLAWGSNVRRSSQILNLLHHKGTPWRIHSWLASGKHSTPVQCTVGVFIKGSNFVFIDW